MVYLDGKDEQGHTKYLNEDGTRHTHLGSSQTIQQTQQPTQQQLQQGSTTIVTPATKEDRILNLLNGLNIKMDRVVAALEKANAADDDKK
jgi:hypothetical protein